MIRERRTAVGGTPPPLIQLGGVFAGTVIGLAAGGLLSLLWLGLAYGSHGHLFYEHLDWWLGATAIFAMLLAGVVAGASSTALGVTAGIANGVTAWALVVLGVAAFGIPALISTSNATVVHIGSRSLTVKTLGWWPSFWSVLIGLGAGAIGGAIGGAPSRRRASAAEPAAVTERDSRVREDERPLRPQDERPLRPEEERPLRPEDETARPRTQPADTEIRP
jgi:hypothetical protein